MDRLEHPAKISGPLSAFYPLPTTTVLPYPSAPRTGLPRAF